jgi:glycogen debranching enzyme
MVAPAGFWKHDHDEGFRAMEDTLQVETQEWTPVGEEPQPPGSITDCAILRNDGISVVSLSSGEIDADRHSATGMYHADTRHLSRLTLSFGGVEPVLLDTREFEHALTAIYTNPGIQLPDKNGGKLPPQTLVVRRRRVIEGGSLIEALSLSNYSAKPVDFDLRVEFAADFQDIFVVRGLDRLSKQPEVQSEVTDDSACFSYDGIDGTRRITIVRFDQAPRVLSDHAALFSIHLDPRETADIQLSVTTSRETRPSRVAEADRRARRQEQEWLHGLAVIQTDDEAVNAALERAMMDIYALRTHLGDREYLAAGVPWFDTLFGRDSLIASIELALFTPELLRISLEVLANYQADTIDPGHDASPGKIPHELRWGELAAAGEVPFGRYYGSVDVTPLFIMAAYDYFRWTGDRETLGRLWPAIQRAMDWCEEHAGDGFLSYSRKSANGLENQGWKDSHDAIVWPDGQLVDGPISLIEVQGYLAAAYHAFAKMSVVMEGADKRNAMRRAAQFTQQMDEAFAHDELGYVLCLDGEGHRVPTPASNAGHLLWTGAARPDLGQRVARRLMKPDMFSGWGIRTLSDTVVGFNPLGYHTGSVWPHDNALILSGMRRYGFEHESQVLSSALIEAALDFPNYRVPELFSGDDREFRHVPTPYPVSSRPQAWAAASVPFVLVSMLGICPGGPGQLYVSGPELPRQLKWVRVRNLRLAGGSVDLVFQRQREEISVEAQNLHGVEVVLSASHPQRLLASR